MHLRTRRWIAAAVLLLLFAVVAPMQPGAISKVAALEKTLIPPNGPEQLPLVFVHGYNSDGGSWATDAGPYWQALRDITPGSEDPDIPAVENWAV